MEGEDLGKVLGFESEELPAGVLWYIKIGRKGGGGSPVCLVAGVRENEALDLAAIIAHGRGLDPNAPTGRFREEWECVGKWWYESAWHWGSKQYRCVVCARKVDISFGDKRTEPVK